MALYPAIHTEYVYLSIYLSSSVKIAQIKPLWFPNPPPGPPKPLQMSKKAELLQQIICTLLSAR